MLNVCFWINGAHIYIWDKHHMRKHRHLIGQTPVRWPLLSTRWQCYCLYSECRNEPSVVFYLKTGNWKTENEYLSCHLLFVYLTQVGKQSTTDRNWFDTKEVLLLRLLLHRCSSGQSSMETATLPPSGWRRDILSTREFLKGLCVNIVELHDIGLKNKCTWPLIDKHTFNISQAEVNTVFTNDLSWEMHSQLLKNTWKSRTCLSTGKKCKSQINSWIWKTYLG